MQDVITELEYERLPDQTQRHYTYCCVTNLYCTFSEKECIICPLYY